MAAIISRKAERNKFMLVFDFFRPAKNGFPIDKSAAKDDGTGFSGFVAFCIQTGLQNSMPV